MPVCCLIYIITTRFDGGIGKTTCLDVLAQRKNIGIVSGTLLLDGKPLALDFARNTAYGEFLNGFHTVRYVLTVVQRSKWMYMKAARPCARL